MLIPISISKDGNTPQKQLFLYALALVSIWQTVQNTMSWLLHICVPQGQPGRVLLVKPSLSCCSINAIVHLVCSSPESSLWNGSKGRRSVKGIVWHRVSQLWPLHLLCRTMACFHVISISLISGGDHPCAHYFLSILPLCALLLCSMTHYDITMGHDVVMCT